MYRLSMVDDRTHGQSLFENAIYCCHLPLYQKGIEEPSAKCGMAVCCCICHIQCRYQVRSVSSEGLRKDRGFMVVMVVGTFHLLNIIREQSDQNATPRLELRSDVNVNIVMKQMLSV